MLKRYKRKTKMSNRYKIIFLISMGILHLALGFTVIEAMLKGVTY